MLLKLTVSRSLSVLTTIGEKIYRNAGYFAVGRSLSATTTKEEACIEMPAI